MSDLPVPHAGRRRPRPAARRRRGGGTDEVRPPSRPGPARPGPALRSSSLRTPCQWVTGVPLGQRSINDRDLSLPGAVHALGSELLIVHSAGRQARREPAADAQVRARQGPRPVPICPFLELLVHE